MSKRSWQSWAALNIGLALVMTLAGGCRKNGPAPTAKSVASTPAPSTFPDTPAGRAADAAVQAARTAGPGANTAYQASLQQLRTSGAEGVSVLVAGYRTADPADYGTRGLLVEILSALGRPEALPALTEIARTPVPKPTRVPHEALNPFVEESIIRVVAIRGIGAFVPADRQAEATLLALLRSDAAPVREEAARALWAASASIEDTARRNAIRERIPPALRVDPERKLGPVAPRDADPTLAPRSGGQTP